MEAASPRSWVSESNEDQVTVNVEIEPQEAGTGATRGDAAVPDNAQGSPLSPVYPLRIGMSRRHLVDQLDRPTFVQGDSAWSLITAVDLSEAEVYLSDRRDKGFNSLWVGLIEHLFSPDPPRNRNGDGPFLIPGDFATPSESYFAHADLVIHAAADRGLQVFLSPCYLGYPDPGYPSYGGKAEGWYDEVLANGVSKCADFGRYVGRRYRDFPNIVWVMGGDRCPGDALEHVRAMASGIAQEDGRHIFTAHVHPECSPVEQYPDDVWLSLNMTYTYSIVHRALLEDYNRRPIRPNVLFESTYEGEHDASELQIRRQAYWALFSGACGQFMGNMPVWMFAAGWKDALDSAGAVAMSHLRRLVDDIEWWDLVPDEDHSLVTAGLGEARGLDRCAAAATPNRSLVVAYLPAKREITVDLRSVPRGGRQARWFDPRTGAYLSATIGRLAPTATLTPPSEGDWVLILEAEPEPAGRAGPI
jgi:hypothetical protein